MGRRKAQWVMSGENGRISAMGRTRDFRHSHGGTVRQIIRNICNPAATPTTRGVGAMALALLESASEEVIFHAT